MGGMTLLADSAIAVLYVLYVHWGYRCWNRVAR